MEAGKQRVLILGGGFGGVKAALELAGHKALEVSLISDQTNFRYYPALYKTATGGKKTASQIPLAEILAGKPVRIIHDSAKTLNRSKKLLKTVSDTSYDYDYLII